MYGAPSYKKVKGVIGKLCAAGEELGHLCLIKKRAVDAEDFETAETLKVQIKTFRKKIYKALGVHELIEGKARQHEDQTADILTLSHDSKAPAR